MVKYDDLTLEKVVIEGRFEKGYLYWDNCGKIWLAINDKWPTLVHSTVTPNEAKFKLGGSEINLAYSYNRIAIEENYPNKLDQFTKFADDSFRIITNDININNLSRIGFRNVYFIGFDVDTITNLLIDKNLFIVPERVKALGKKVTATQIKFDIEREDISITVRTGFGKKSIEVTAPKPFKVDTSGFIKEGFYIDFDFFSDKIVDLGTFSVKNFLEVQENNARKLIATLFD